MDGVALIHVVPRDRFVFDCFDLRWFPLLFRIVDPKRINQYHETLLHQITNVGPIMRLMLACVSCRSWAASSVLK